MNWIADPNAWLGLATLIGLEIVLGIDNLVFTAILANRLPEPQRRHARLVGLSLALIMRLGLLAAISALAQLTKPLLSVAGFSFSGRDLILIGGGIFLLAKGTTELNERIEAAHEGAAPRRKPPAFWQVIVQIILLDLVFSLDSIITAVGMVEHLSIMVIAVVVAVTAMIFASGPLTNFVNGRPTVVILCLGFLLLIGFSLITEGFGLHIPKAYLYAAILFSVLVESANELRRRNQKRHFAAATRRERASEAILRMLGAEQASAGGGEAELRTRRQARAGRAPDDPRRDGAWRAAPALADDAARGCRMARCRPARGGRSRPGRAAAAFVRAAGARADRRTGRRRAHARIAGGLVGGTLRSARFRAGAAGAA